MNKLVLIDEMLKERAIDFRKKKDGDNFTEFPDFRPGSSVEVGVRVIEGEKERIQIFKGVIIGRHGRGISKTFRVRKISNGVGVERVFPLYSPMIQSIKIIKSGDSRKSKLYYLRGMSEKKIRQKLS